ncbi:MAG: phosphate-starvation-inducible PsiE family protein [Acidobacteriota bacterium]
MESASGAKARQLITRSLEIVEDVVYVGLGALLVAAAIALLFTTAWNFGAALMAGQLSGHVVLILDQILLVLLIIELLYTVQVSFREHTLVPEPFLVVGLIATVRKLLVVTAQFPQLGELPDVAFKHTMVELVLLSGMVVVLVVSLLLMHRYGRLPGHELK